MNENHLKKYSEAGFLPSVCREDVSKLLVKNIQSQPESTDEWLDQFPHIQKEGVYSPALDFRQSSERESSFFIQKLESQSRLLVPFLTRPSPKNDQEDKRANSISQLGSLDCKCACPVQVQIKSPMWQLDLIIKFSNNTNETLIVKE